MKRYMIGLALFVMHLSFSQTYVEEGVSTEEMVILEGDKFTPMALANLGIDFSMNPKVNSVEGNSVFLEQIGDYNQADIRTNTQESEINLTQRGNNNYTTLDYTTRTAFADLVQDGNYNTIKDFALNPNEDISLELVQEGNNLNFEREGINELTKSLKFRQTEASPNLIIRSFP